MSIWNPVPGDLQKIFIIAKIAAKYHVLHLVLSAEQKLTIKVRKVIEDIWMHVGMLKKPVQKKSHTCEANCITSENDKASHSHA